MADNKYFEILENIYNLTDNTTPRRFDCGELCGKRCCGNLSKDSNKSGMTLLPYEKEFLLSKGANFSFEKSEDGDLLICDGNCKRELRPFACRIFPYYADFKDLSIRIKKDLRAASICPLLTTNIGKRADIYFLRSIKRSVRLLQKENCFADELTGISDFIEYLHELYKKMEE